MNDFDNIAEDVDLDEVFVPTDEDYTNLYAEDNNEWNPTDFNLVEHADADCLTGDCDHFCGEPTNADLRRMERRGYARQVDAYEQSLFAL